MSLVYPLPVLNSSTIGGYNYQLFPENLRGGKLRFLERKKTDRRFYG
jgi:hypothetical protein